MMPLQWQHKQKHESGPQHMYSRQSRSFRCLMLLCWTKAFHDGQQRRSCCNRACCFVCCWLDLTVAGILEQSFVVVGAELDSQATTTNNNELRINGLQSKLGEASEVQFTNQSHKHTTVRTTPDTEMLDQCCCRPRQGVVGCKQLPTEENNLRQLQSEV